MCHMSHAMCHMSPNWPEGSDINGSYGKGKTKNNKKNLLPVWGAGFSRLVVIVPNFFLLLHAQNFFAYLKKVP